MVYQVLYDFSSGYSFQMYQQMDKVVVQEKIFPNKSHQMTTIIKQVVLMYIAIENMFDDFQKCDCLCKNQPSLHKTFKFIYSYS